MILPKKKSLDSDQLKELTRICSEFDVKIQEITGADRTIYAMIGDETPQLLKNRIEGLDYIQEIRQIQVPYKLLAKENNHSEITHIINGKTVGKDFIVIAGHCTIDPNQPELFMETSHALKEAGVDMLRGGVWKPRTSPYSFQGDDKSIQILVDAREKYGLGIVTEVMDEDQVKLCVEAKIDMLQVGARNALNYKLLGQIGRHTAGTNMMALLKRSIHMGSADEFILAAEYIAGSGNTNVMLCPRGTAPTMPGYRNHPDEAITQLLKEKTWAPVIVDPSHSVGKAQYVPRAAMAAAAYGADGVIIETHCSPIKGMGDDPKQALTPDVIKKLIPDLQAISAFSKDFSSEK